MSKQITPTSIFLLEWLGGMVGLLGLGHLYIGRTQEGLIRLIWWIIWLVMVYILIYLLPFRVFAVCFCVPLHGAIQILVPFWLANRLKKEVIDSR